MVAHILPHHEGVHSSPANVQHHQIRGHARNNPHLTLPSRAETDRIFMMSNAPHTTVPLRFDNMMKAYLPPIDPDEFDAVYSEHGISTIQRAFKNAIDPSSKRKKGKGRKGKGKKGKGKKGKKGEEVEDDPAQDEQARDDQVQDAQVQDAQFQDAQVQDQVKENSVTEKSVSEAWRKIYNETLCPGYLLNISETRADETDPKKYKIDAALISTADRDLIVEGRPNFFLDDLPIEFKGGKTEHDGWDDRAKKNMEPEADTRTGVRGQLMSYGERIYFYQHRTGLFMLLVNGGEFRVIRWDRSGCIVTEAVNYVDSVEGTRKLLEFLYGYSKATPEQRGFDPTATRLSKASCGWQWMQKVAAEHSQDIAHAEDTIIESLPPGFVTEPTRDAPTSSLFVSKVLTDDPASGRGFGDLSAPSAITAITPVFKYVRDLFRKSLEQTGMCYSLKICGCDYLVGDPVFAPQGLIGRGTRGYVALEWKTQRLVFLKDAWRPFYHGVDQEGATLAALNAANVLYVPTLVCHEDVGGGQETEASQYSSTGSKKRDVFGEEEKKNRPIAPLPRSRSKGSGSNASTTKKARKLSGGGSTGTSQTQAASGSNGSQSTGKATDAGSAGSGERSAKRSLPKDTGPVLHPGKDGLGLRHLTHYRIVVAEVCLPSTDIESGEQLLQIIYYCMIGHRDAAVKCGILHRDISTGNILIRPAVVGNNSETGQSIVVWYGVLTDWELAKALPKDNTITRARQPHRTGTWYYMSVYSLMHPECPVCIADELESFFHVLLYLALRFLRTNCRNVMSFVKNYFEGSSTDERGKVTCGPVKENIIYSGSLKWQRKAIHFLSGPMPAERGMQPQTNANHHLSPLDDIISTYLAYFEARYAVLDYESKTSTERSKPLPSKPLPSLQSTIDAATPSSMAAKKVKQIHLAAIGLPDDADSDSDSKTAPGVNQPTKPIPAVYKRAAKLETHDAILKVLAKGIHKEGWSPDDCVGDQFKGYVPSEMQSTAKKIRLQMRSTLAPVPEGQELTVRPHTAV